MENVTFTRQVKLELTWEQYGLLPRYEETNLAQDINSDFQRYLHDNPTSPNAAKEKMWALCVTLGDAVGDEMKFFETVQSVVREFYQV